MGAVAANLVRAADQLPQAQKVCSSSYWLEMSQKALYIRKGQYQSKQILLTNPQIHFLQETMAAKKSSKWDLWSLPVIF